MRVIPAASVWRRMSDISVVDVGAAEADARLGMMFLRWSEHHGS